MSQGHAQAWAQFEPEESTVTTPQFMINCNADEEPKLAESVL